MKSETEQRNSFRASRCHVMAWPGRACTKLKLTVLKNEASPQTIIKIKVKSQQFLWALLQRVILLKENLSLAKMLKISQSWAFSFLAFLFDTSFSQYFNLSFDASVKEAASWAALTPQWRHLCLHQLLWHSLPLLSAGRRFSSFSFCTWHLQLLALQSEMCCAKLFCYWALLGSAALNSRSRASSLSASGWHLEQHLWETWSHLLTSVLMPLCPLVPQHSFWLPFLWWKMAAAGWETLLSDLTAGRKGLQKLRRLSQGTFMLVPKYRVVNSQELWGRCVICQKTFMCCFESTRQISPQGICVSRFQ